MKKAGGTLVPVESTIVESMGWGETGGRGGGGRITVSLNSPCMS